VLAAPLSSRDPIAHPVTLRHVPNHQPSSTLKFGTPLWVAFMPLVPEASKGRRGVLSHRSHPDTIGSAMSMV
jgi:hypothetical protein